MRKGGDRRNRGPRRGTHEGDPRARDLALAAAALAGDREALETFLQRMRCIPRFIARLTRGGSLGTLRTERADLAQEAFRRVWAELPAYEGRASLETWAWRFCAHVVSEARRRRKPLTGDPPERPAPEPGGLDPDEELRIHAALETLEPELRAVVELKHFEGETFPALATRLGISPNTAKTRYYRALAILRLRLRLSFPGLEEASPAEVEEDRR